MKSVFTLITFITLPFVTYSQEWQWARDIYLDTEIQLQIEDVAVDNNDNNYVVGDYERASIGKDFGFVEKYTGGGELVWSTKFEPVDDFEPVRVGAIDIKSTGNPVIIGTIRGPTTFGTIVLDPGYIEKPFVAELDRQSGEFTWAKLLNGAAGWDLGRDIKVDKNNNLFTINDDFLSKLDPVGELMWELNSAIYATTVVLDSKGNSYIVGTFGNTLVLPDKTIESLGSSDILAAKYDSKGNYVWSEHFGGPIRDYVTSCTIDANDQLIFTGYAGSILTLDEPVIGYGYDDVLIVKLELNGDILSVDLLGSDITDSGLAITSDKNGQFYISSEIGGSYFKYRGDSIALDKVNNTFHSFLFRLNDTGDINWTYKFNNSYSEELGEYYAPQATDVALNSEANLFISLRYLEYADLGDTVIVSSTRDGTGIGLLKPETGDFVIAEREPPYCESDSIKLTADIELTGGTNFLWSTGETTPSIYVSETGNYSVKAFNDASTIVRDSDIITIEFLPLPVITIVAESNVLCPGTEQVLDAGPGFDNYLWSTGETTQTIMVSETGNYSVTVTSIGCSNSDTIDIEVAQPFNETICMVTNEYGWNQVVWQKTKDKRTSSYNVYKQGAQSDLYELIANVPFNKESTYVDHDSEPEVKSDFYKISTVDSCGNESALSPFHQTIHLSQSIGIDGEINLSWNKYQGFDYNTFNVYRGSSIDVMTLIAEVAGNIFAFTDQTPPSGNLYYQIGVNSTDPCETEIPGGRNNSLFQEARSNITSRTVTALADDLWKRIAVYPNPVTEAINIRFDQVPRQYEMEILDPVGKLVKSYAGTISGEFSLTIPSIKRGVYMLKISNDQLGTKVLKLVVE